MVAVPPPGLRVCTALLLWFALAGAAQTAIMDDVFDDSKVHEIRLTTDAANWDQLREHYLEDTYYPVRFEWNGIALEGVGIRSRGNGSRSDVKPGLKVDFNRYKSGQTFAGLKSLVLDNLTQDPAMMRERVSMALFRRMGIPAPRVAHAKLFVNDVYQGLYTVVEPVDKGFLSRNLKEDGGYLYDYEWAFEYGFEYLGPEDSLYSPLPFQLETNTSKPRPEPLIAMIRTINDAPDEEFVGAVSQYLNPQEVLTYLAVETFLAEADGLAGNWRLNNFYLYGFDKSDRFTLIPWDRDVAFQEAARPIWLNMDRNVLLRRLLAVPELREHFLAELKRCAEAAGGLGGWLEGQVEASAEQVRSAVADDPNKTFTYPQFEESVDHLRYFAFERQRAIEEELAAEATAAQ